MGRVEWIGVRPASNQPMIPLQSVQAVAERGIEGDRGMEGRVGRKRQLTFIRQDHLVEIGAALGEGPVDPSRLRRNIVVSGVELMPLIGRRFRVGTVICEGTMECDPCDKMDVALGAGGKDAMLDRGGLTAKICESGVIRVGDEFEVLPD